MSRKNIPAVQNQFQLDSPSKTDEEKTPIISATERARSTQRALTKSRFEKLEITNYKEKRSEHLMKHSSRVRGNVGSKNLISELNKIEVKRNTSSFVESPDKTNMLNIKTSELSGGMFRTLRKPEDLQISSINERRKEKSLARSPEIDKDNRKTSSQQKTYTRRIKPKPVINQESVSKISDNRPFDVVIEDRKQPKYGYSVEHKSKPAQTERIHYKRRSLK